MELILENKFALAEIIFFANDSSDSSPERKRSLTFHEKFFKSLVQNTLIMAAGQFTICIKSLNTVDNFWLEIWTKEIGNGQCSK